MPTQPLTLSGSFYDIGYQHGQAFKEAIQDFAEKRVQYSQTEYWTGRNLSEASVLALARACLVEHEAYAPELMQELRGMADASEVSLEALLIVNGFTDFIDTVYAVGDILKAESPLVSSIPHAEDNCTAFLIPNARTQEHKGIFGQTWDMNPAAKSFVRTIKGIPDNSPQFITFTIAGCIGMIGMNEFGITVGINNILGGDGQIGIMWPFVIRKILQQNNIQDALRCITEAKLAGAHNYMLMDAEGSAYSVEAMSSVCQVTALEDQEIIHTNHCLYEPTLRVERKREAVSQKSSEDRYRNAVNYIQEMDTIGIEDLKRLTADVDAICLHHKPELQLETCGAVIAQPADRSFWVVAGSPDENEYVKYTI